MRYNGGTVLGDFVILQTVNIHFFLSGWPSVCMGQADSQRTDFHEISYLIIFFRKSVEKIQVLLKSDENTGRFTLTPTYIYDNFQVNLT
jgi:hypothetical protein